jgi:alpha-N-arabinofuranosidase
VNHSQVIFRSKQPDGPYLPFTDHPTLTQRDLDPDRSHPVTCTGHADFEIGPDGNWWTVFLACTPYEGGHYNTGRQTFLLPVTWKDDWPLILPPGKPVPFVHRGPNGIGFETGAAVPLTGNFSWQDDFDRDELGDPWLFMRAPQEQWWSTGDGLTITPRSDSLRGRHNPSFIGRRLQHNRFEVAIDMELPTSPGVEAGLVAYHNESHHYVLGVERADAGYRVFLEKQQGAAEDSQVTEASIDADPGDPVTLRLTGYDVDYTFEFSRDGGATWIQVGGIQDARNLSVETSYDFIGVLLGPMARMP